ncbi:MAG: hypothetical protein MUF54_19995 [Polyangiaceae bacterium]|jgi:hypothetical protein|nr:hypothetical protein [Polyangiaceae bacterium]
MGSTSAAWRARTLQKLSILREARESGAVLRGVLDVNGDMPVPPDTPCSARAAFPAPLHGSAAQLFHFETAGLIHLYVQPFAHANPVPGEHHVQVAGGLCASVGYMNQRGLGKRWLTLQQQPAPVRFSQSRAVRDAMSAARWKWRVGMGAFAMEWLVQARPAGPGVVHVCMMATGETRISAHQIGIQDVARIVNALAPLMDDAAPAVEQPFVCPVSFGNLLGQVARGARIFAAPAARTSTQDFSGAIRDALASRVDPGLLTPPLPARKEHNVRTAVLPASAQSFPILAVVDLTVFGSAKDAVVFTPTHCFLRDGDERLTFAWTEVRAVRPPQGERERELLIVLSSTGEIALPCGRAAVALAPLMQRFAELP